MLIVSIKGELTVAKYRTKRIEFVDAEYNEFAKRWKVYHTKEDYNWYTEKKFHEKFERVENETAS